MTGTLLSIDIVKGFGFIRGSDGKEYFFHRSALKDCTIDTLERGQPVTFEPGMTDKGPRANDVALDPTGYGFG